MEIGINCGDIWFAGLFVQAVFAYLGRLFALYGVF